MDFPFGRPFEHRRRREEEPPVYPPPPPLPTQPETHNPYRPDSDVFHIHHETHNPYRDDSDVYPVPHENHNPLRNDSNAIHIHHAVDVPHRDDQYYPPPGTRSFSPPPPPPAVRHIHHEQSGPFMSPPPFSSNVQRVAHESHAPLPPFTSNVQHVAHESHAHLPSFSSSVQHVAHESHAPLPPFSSNVQHVAHESHAPLPRPGPFPSHNSPWPDHRAVLPRGEDVRVFCEAEMGYSLTIRDGSVVLTRSNPYDEFQHWIKDETYGTKVKDQEGFPSFALVNKATGQALQHAIGATQPVRLKPYHPDEFDESILWTKSKDVGHGFRAIRMVNNIRLNLDAFNGDKNHGGVHDGTIAVLWEWKKGDNQRWKLLPYCKERDTKFLYIIIRTSKTLIYSKLFVFFKLCISGFIYYFFLFRACLSLRFWYQDNNINHNTRTFDVVT